VYSTIIRYVRDGSKLGNKIASNMP